MNVYRIQAKRVDEAVDFCLSHYVEGRLGNTTPALLARHTSFSACMDDIVHDVDEALHCEYRVEANLHDGGSMDTGATCNVCGMVGCDTPYWLEPRPVVQGPVEKAVEGYYCKIDETDY